MKRINSIVLACLLGLTAAVQAAEVRDVRFWRAPDHSRVVFDLSGPVTHELITLSNPHRLVIDIQNTKLAADTQKLQFSNSPVTGLRHADKPGGALRIVFDLSADVQVRSFLLAASGDLHDRLVVDFLDKGESVEAQVIKSVETVRSVMWLSPSTPVTAVKILAQLGRGGLKKKMWSSRLPRVSKSALNARKAIAW